MFRSFPSSVVVDFGASSKDSDFFVKRSGLAALSISIGARVSQLPAGPRSGINKLQMFEIGLPAIGKRVSSVSGAP